MKRTNLNIVWGLLLIAAGVLFLLQTFSFIAMGPAWEVLWGLAFAAGGIGLTWWFIRDSKEAWWAAIPGFTLLALAALIGLHMMGFADEGSNWLGSLFLGAIGLSFWTVYFTRRDHWWAVIPGGVLFTLAGVALIATAFPPEVVGAIFFFGMALTFVLVYLLPTHQGRMTWALIPAGVLGTLGLATLMAFTSVLNYVWAVGLILIGVYMILRQRGGGEVKGPS